MPVYGTVLVRVKHECSRLKVTLGALLSGSASATWLFRSVSYSGKTCVFQTSARPVPGRQISFA